MRDGRAGRGDVEDGDVEGLGPRRPHPQRSQVPDHPLGPSRIQVELGVRIRVRGYPNRHAFGPDDPVGQTKCMNEGAPSAKSKVLRYFEEIAVGVTRVEEFGCEPDAQGSRGR